MSEWTLTTEDERIVLATARYNKIKKLQWLAKSDPLRKDVDDVELDESEREAALSQANKAKAWGLLTDKIKAESRQRARIEAEETRAKWNYQHFYRVMKDEAWKMGTELIYNDQTERLIKTICFKLARDARYEADMGFSFRKGLIIRGEPGLGKTWLVSLVAANPVCSVQMVTMHEIIRSVLDSGTYTGLKFASHDLVYLDDVGTEGGEVTYFGTKINWFKTWFEEIYAKNKHSLCRVILSTNCSFDEIERIYGFRVRDRLAEMFDVIDIKGKSMRRN